MEVGDRVRYDEPKGCHSSWHPPDGAVGTVREIVCTNDEYVVHVLFDKGFAPDGLGPCPVFVGEKGGCWWFGTDPSGGLLFPDDDIGNLTVIASG